MKFLLRAAGVPAALLLAGVAAAQSPTPSWGSGGNHSLYTVQAWDMAVVDSSMTWTINFAVGGYRYLTTVGQLYAGVPLPRGALITAIELDACDSSPSGEVHADLLRGATGSSTTLTFVQTGAAATPGCGRFAVNLATPETVDSTPYRYWVSASNSSFDSETSIGSIRILYQLQVSPAPDVASFADVPTTDPAFQFVEALYSSAVTAGCGNGNYCPDAPLTRRQMAVFLAKLVGLNWPEGLAP